jgi:hypothetical protein
VSLQLNRPDGKGGLTPRPADDRNWRSQLQSPRWGAALPGARLPRLRNPEMNPTNRFIAAMFWVGLAVATFMLLVLGYGTGFWHFTG